LSKPVQDGVQPLDELEEEELEEELTSPEEELLEETRPEEEEEEEPEEELEDEEEEIGLQLGSANVTTTSSVTTNKARDTTRNAI